jgi:hypothetical protein
MEKIYFLIFIFIVIIIIFSFFILLKNQTFLSKKESTAEIIDENLKKQTFKEPEIIKAIYLTSWSAAIPEVVDYVIDIAENTEINSVVVDIKDWSGFVSYDTEVLEAEKYNAERVIIPDIEGFLKRFHKQGIYVIARITVFQDPVLARARPDLAVRQKSNESLLWLDNSGLAWIDPASKEAWDYNIKIAKEAAKRGFDELNFDYIRFPSDGNLQDIIFPVWNGSSSKDLIIKDFFKNIREEIPQSTISVDLFGLSTVNSGLGVGQRIENAYQYFDFVCPMVYPSHYEEGFLSYQNPAEYPYEVVRYSMEKALNKLNTFKQEQQTRVKLRPWLQDFDLGAVYNKEEIQLEIKAVSDALLDNFSGFMLWNSENIYTKEAILKGY